MVLRANCHPSVIGWISLSLTKARRQISSGFARPANAPRAQQAEQRLLLGIEPGILARAPRANDVAEVVDRSAVEILLHDRGTDIRRTCDRGQCFPGARRPSASPTQRSSSARSPSPTPPRSASSIAATRVPPQVRKSFALELLAQVFADVLVQPARAEVDELAVVLVANESPAAGSGEQLLDRARELVVDEHRAAEDAVLGAEPKRDLAAAHFDVPLAQRGIPTSCTSWRSARRRPETSRR